MKKEHPAEGPFPVTYLEAIDFLFRSLPMYQRIGKAAYKANLDNTMELDRYFGHPHRNRVPCLFHGQTDFPG